MSHLWKKVGEAIICVSLLVGCTDTKVLEKLGIAVAVGCDALPENKLLITSVLMNSEFGAKKKTKIVSGSSYSGKGGRSINNRQMSHTLVSGQVRVIVFEDEMSKQGLIHILETLSRDPVLGDMIYLVISQGSSQKLLSYNYKDINNIGTYLYEMIQQHVRDDWVPSCTVHDFRKVCYGVGTDANLPLLRVRDGGVEMFGLAVFHNDRMVGKLNPEEGYLLKLLLGKNKADIKEIKVNSKGLRPYLHESRQSDSHVRVVFSNLGNKNNIRVISAENTEFQVNVRMDVEIREITGSYDFSNLKAYDLLEQHMEEALTKELEKLMAKLQRFNSDAVGFGEIYRSSVRGSKLTVDKWHDMFPKARIRPHVKVNIVRVGTVY